MDVIQMRKLRAFFIILFIIGLLAFTEGYFLQWIILDPRYSLIISGVHIHHWQIGIGLALISLIGIAFSGEKY
jgi:hypothetical protein